MIKNPIPTQHLITAACISPYNPQLADHFSALYVAAISPAHNITSLWVTKIKEEAVKANLFKGNMRKEIRRAEKLVEDIDTQLAHGARDCYIADKQTFFLDYLDATETIVAHDIEVFYYSLLRHIRRHTATPHQHLLATVCLTLFLARCAAKIHHTITHESLRKCQAFPTSFRFDYDGLVRILDYTAELITKQPIDFTQDPDCRLAYDVLTGKLLDFHLLSKAADEAYRRNPEFQPDTP